MRNVRSCYNCGLPEDATCSPGETLRLRILSKARFKRDCTKTVWVCAPVCSLQARAIAAMGPATYKWPMTLAEFAATEKRHHRRSLAGQTVTKTDANRQCLRGSQRDDFANMELPQPESVLVTQEGPGTHRKGGRPRVANPLSPAERMRAYRQRKSRNYEISQTSA